MKPFCELSPDHERITVTVTVNGGRYWLTSVIPKEGTDLTWAAIHGTGPKGEAIAKARALLWIEQNQAEVKRLIAQAQLFSSQV